MMGLNEQSYKIHPYNQTSKLCQLLVTLLL